MEQGLDGVVLKVDNMDDIIKLKDYFDRRNEAKSQLQLTKATVSKVEVVSMGDRVCVDLCSIMRPGEGLLHTSQPPSLRGILFLGWILRKRNVPCSFRMLGNKLHCKQAFQGECSKSCNKLDGSMLLYCNTTKTPATSCLSIFRGLYMHMSLSLGAKLATSQTCYQAKK